MIEDVGHRRRVLWHGALLLLVSFALGIVTATAPPHSRSWMASHLVALIGSPLVLGVGLVWAELRLSRGQETALFRLLLTGMYGGVATSVFAAIVNFPGPATQPGVSAPGWQQSVFLLLLLLVVPSLVAAASLLLYGLRGKQAL